MQFHSPIQLACSHFLPDKHFLSEKHIAPRPKLPIIYNPICKSILILDHYIQAAAIQAFCHTNRSLESEVCVQFKYHHILIDANQPNFTALHICGKRRLDFGAALEAQFWGKCIKLAVDNATVPTCSLGIGAKIGTVFS